jgi:hypothetical protein
VRVRAIDASWPDPTPDQSGLNRSMDELVLT